MGTLNAIRRPEACRGVQIRRPPDRDSCCHFHIGNFASQDLIFFCAICVEALRRIAETVILPCKMTKSIAEISGDDESAQKLRRNLSKSRLAKFPRRGWGEPAAPQKDCFFA